MGNRHAAAAMPSRATLRRRSLGEQDIGGNPLKRRFRSPTRPGALHVAQAIGGLRSRRRSANSTGGPSAIAKAGARRSEEHTSELQSLMRNSYAVFCLKTKKQQLTNNK